MLEPLGQMRIAKRGDAVRLQLENLLDGAINALSRLVRQSVDEINIDRANAARSEAVDGRLCDLEALLAPDGCLHRRFEILHTDGHAVDARTKERIRLSRVEVAGVDLHGELRIVPDVEAGADSVGECGQVVCR